MDIRQGNVATDRQKIRTLSKLLGTHEKSTLLFEYVRNIRYRFDQRGVITEVAFYKGHGQWHKVRG